MTRVVEVPTLEEKIAELERREFALEQKRGLSYTTPAGTIPSFSSGISVGDVAPIYVDEDIAAPTGLTVTSGTFFDVAFIDASWTAPTGAAGAQIVEYEAELTKTGQGVSRVIRTSGTSVRFEPVEPNVAYSVRVRGINKLGISSGWTTPAAITSGIDASLPAQVSGLTLGAGLKSVIARWTENTEQDMKNGAGLYEAQLDTASTFDSQAGQPLRSVRVSAIIVAFTDLTSGVLYYVRVRAIDSSGNFGAFSATSSVTTGQAQTVDIADLAITNAKIGNLAVDSAKVSSLDAAKITFGTMSGDRIAVNTLDAAAIKTSSLTAQTITISASGLLRAGRVTTPFHYLLLDAAGIRFFKNGTAAFTGGTLTVDINVSTGSATFKGNVDAISGTFSGVITMTVAGKIVGASALPRWELAGGPSETVLSHVVSAGDLTHGRVGFQDNESFLFVRRVNSARKAVALHLFHDSGANDASGFLYVDTGGQFFVNASRASIRVNAVDKLTVLSNRIDVLTETYLGNNPIYLRGAGDLNHKIAYESTIDGGELTGWAGVKMRANGYSPAAVECKIGADGTRHQGADGAWLDSHASTHINESDRRIKDDLREPGSLLSFARTIPVWNGRYKKELDPYRSLPRLLGRRRFTVISQDLPPEVTIERDLGGGVPGTSLGIDTAAMDAYLLKLIQELDAEVEELKAKVHG
jgi:hypothetical protein